ncbi:FAD-dependent oxidoreductase [Thermodesulfobacteriota bacterium]
MSGSYPNLFEPISIGKVKIKNRIAMAPMGIVGLTNPEGNPTQRAIDYYIERAKGDVGLIITSLFKVDNTIEVNFGRMELISHVSSTPLGELCDVIHSLGTKIFIQLTAGFGRVSRKGRFVDKPVSASAVPNYHDPRITCRPLKTDEVEKLVKSFGDAAEIAAISGMDGIELHGHEGYIFDQFTTAIWNKRTDKYGGDLRGRLTLPIEVLREIKKRVGDDYPVQYRFGLKHYIKGLNSGALRGEEFIEAGRDIEEGLEMAKILEEAGYDSLHVDAGCYDSWYWAHPPSYQEYGCMVDMAEKVKEVVDIPVTAVGRLEIPELAEEVIEKGKADMVALGRGLLADPYWPIKVRKGETKDIRPCIGCHGCFGRFPFGRPLSCAVNPTCGRETLYPITPAEKPGRILIVGGGIAGMEAARISTLRGHKVTIYEKTRVLGGHLIEASVPDFKNDLRRLGDWYKCQIDKLGIEVKYETEVSKVLIEKEKPDAVIIATGSRPIIPDLPGINRDNVCTCIELLLGEKEAGDKIVVAGGGLVGCETALWLAQKGKDVTIVEILPELMLSGPIVPPMNRRMLLDLLAFNKVNIITNSGVQEINDKGAVITEKELLSRDVIEADTVVLALGMKSNDDFYYEVLKSTVAHVYSVGDCREIRNIYGAVWDGFEVGRVV